MTRRSRSLTLLVSLMVAALVVLAVCGATLARSTLGAARSAGAIASESAGDLLRSGGFGVAVASAGQAAWYVGWTSAGTRIDFQLSASGRWVRDFDFGSPTFPCATAVGPPVVLPVDDGNFPLIGLGVHDGTFQGDLHPEEYTPDAPEGYQQGATVTGRFIDEQHVTGTITGWTERDACAPDSLTFTATRFGSLPARPVSGGRYAGQAVSGASVGFTVSRSGRRVIAFRIGGPLDSWCMQGGNLNSVALLSLDHSYPAAGLAQNRDGEFAGILSSGLTPRGRPAGTRMQVSVLFLNPLEATGTVRLLDQTCARYETWPWRATLQDWL